MTNRVLMVLDSMGTGGTETYVLSLGKPLSACGVRLFCGGADGPLHPQFRQAGYQVQLIKSDLQPLPARRQAERRAYRKLMEEQGITVVHVHQTPSGIVAASAARALGIPVVFTMHGTYYPREEALELAQLCDAVISVSKPVQRYWKEWGVSSTVISNGVDLEAFRPLAKGVLEEAVLPEIPGGATVVTYVSRLAWQKAAVCNMVLRSTKAWPPEKNDVHLVVVGTGAQAFHVQELVRNLNRLRKRVYIHMAGEQTDVRPYYRKSDLVIGTGRVALEAMACGKPVLAIGNHGFLGLVKPELYGKAWDYYFGDHDSIKKPSAHLIEAALTEALRDRGALQHTGVQGRAWIEAAFDIRQKAREILAMYERVMTSQEGGGAR